MTNDIDIVVRLLPPRVANLCDAFPEDEFYVSREVALESARSGGQFNVLHPKSGLKIDFMVAQDSDFNTSRFKRAQFLSIVPGITAAFASPEDVILKKLEYFREGGSEKHLRDIVGVIKIVGPGIDRDYLERWATLLGLSELWIQVSNAATKDQRPE